jgi:hypothetical protein
MMNDRIRELAEHCDFYIGNEHYDKSHEEQQRLFMEKFAELIIRECVQTLLDNTPMLDENESLEDWNKGYIRAMLDCEHHIKEHFGVE